MADAPPVLTEEQLQEIGKDHLIVILQGASLVRAPAGGLAANDYAAPMPWLKMSLQETLQRARQRTLQRQ